MIWENVRYWFNRITRVIHKDSCPNCLMDNDVSGAGSGCCPNSGLNPSPIWRSPIMRLPEIPLHTLVSPPPDLGGGVMNRRHLISVSLVAALALFSQQPEPASAQSASSLLVGNAGASQPRQHYEPGYGLGPGVHHRRPRRGQSRQRPQDAGQAVETGGP